MLIMSVQYHNQCTYIALFVYGRQLIIVVFLLGIIFQCLHYLNGMM